MQLASGYLWFKALHVAFHGDVVCGPVSTCPRLFIYHTDATEYQVSDDRFVVMERRLFAIMTIGAVLTAIFGFHAALDQPGAFRPGLVSPEARAAGGPGHLSLALPRLDPPAARRRKAGRHALAPLV